MKYSAVALSFAAVAAAKPAFLNSDFTVVEGESFTLTFSGCDAGCTITLENGPEENLQTVQELTSSATGGEFTVTLDTIPTDDYAFKITDNDSGEYNYSEMFEFEGTGEAPATTTDVEVTTTEAPETTTSAESTSTTEESTTEEETTITTEEETTVTSTAESTTFTTTSSVPVTTTESSSSTETEESSSTTAADTAETTAPDGGAGSLARPMALVIGAVGAILLFN